MKNSKYRNKKIEIDGMKFDSKREYEHWLYLCQLQDGKVISDLDRQVVFELLPAQYEIPSVGPRGGKGKPKCIERSVKYIADFVYKDKYGSIVVEDLKGYKTPEYVLKRKLMLYLKGIRVKEVH